MTDYCNRGGGGSWGSRDIFHNGVMLLNCLCDPDVEKEYGSKGEGEKRCYSAFILVLLHFQLRVVRIVNPQRRALHFPTFASSVVWWVLACLITAPYRVIRIYALLHVLLCVKIQDVPSSSPPSSTSRVLVQKVRKAGSQSCFIEGSTPKKML